MEFQSSVKVAGDSRNLFQGPNQAPRSNVDGEAGNTGIKELESWD